MSNLLPLLAGDAGSVQLIAGLAAGVVCGGIGYIVGARKGRGTGGLILGFLLGPLGLLITSMLGPAEGDRPIGGRRSGRASGRRRRAGSGREAAPASGSRTRLTPAMRAPRGR